MARTEYFGTKVRVIQYGNSDSMVHGVNSFFELTGEEARLMERNIKAGLLAYGDTESAEFAEYMDRLVGTYENHEILSLARKP